VRGIAHAQSGNEEEAVAAFRKALMLQPNEPRYSYNIAVLRFANGDLDGARTAVREARKVDPSFEPGTVLEDRIATNDRSSPVNFLIPEEGGDFPELFPEAQDHAIPIMRGLDRPWTMIGWAFVALALVAGAMYLIYRPIGVAQKMFAQSPMTKTPGAEATVFVLLVSDILTGLWMLIDIVDRKQRLIWLIPYVVCCSAGMHAFPQLLYMAMRKK
jgi:tetratricopeptide (TPR) repeat protein